MKASLYIAALAAAALFGTHYATASDMLRNHPMYTEAQPSAADLSMAAAFIITGNKGSYWVSEGLSTSAAKRQALLDFVSAGGLLILLGGLTPSGGNQFIPLIDFLLGAEGPSGCTPALVTAEFLAYKRLDIGRLGSLPSPIKVKPGMGVSELVCPVKDVTLGVYTGTDPVTKKVASVAQLWSVGEGSVLWLGSGFAVPHLKGYEQEDSAPPPYEDIPPPTEDVSPPPPRRNGRRSLA
ncbi:hypothetical protein TSOC_010743 [Tetrabaena socialis]|uniref:Uncharacterized protein n=1 Tax=Tetrabaena socialis TaxID=47790 RepID=A0A2J7ZSK7_9CHLO|nr:hypothetical protein TSOC_010743 [Tetrabaena socialis]|eukprot:PNH03230.1 hypothetical protein TSOC_010743 [Tetrabaena socialis]